MLKHGTGPLFKARQADGTTLPLDPKEMEIGLRLVKREGDTLFTLARQYYNNAERFGAIYQATRSVLRVPDPLPVGAELVIPDAPAAWQNP